MGTKSLSSGHNCERSEAFGCCSSRHPQKHLLNFQGTGMPLGEAGHKGVLPVLLPAGSSCKANPHPTLCSPPPPGSGGRPQGVLRLQRLPGKLLISPGGSSTHLITITGSQHSPHRSPSPSPAPGTPHSCPQPLFLPRDSVTKQPAAGPSPARGTRHTTKSPRGKNKLCRAAWQRQAALSTPSLLLNLLPPQKLSWG